MKIFDNMWFNSLKRSSRPEWFGAVFWPLLAVLPLTAGIVYGLLYSFGAVGILSEGLTLQFWQDSLTNPDLLFSFAYSFYVAIISMIASVLAALALTGVFRSYSDRRWSGLLLYLPLALPSVVTAFFVYEMFGQSGWLSRLARQAGWTASADAFPILIQDPYAAGIIIAHVMMAAPFFLILFINIYQNEDIGRLRRVASSLGASSFQCDVRITLPILLQRSYPTLVLYFIFAMGSFEIPLLLGPSSPQMVAVVVVRKLRQFSLDTIPQAYILSLLYVMVVLAAVWLLLRNKKLFYDLQD